MKIKSCLKSKLLIQTDMFFPCGSAGKESTCNAGDLGSIPELGRSPGEGKGYPLQYSGLENSMDCIVYGVAKHRTQLSDFHFHIFYHLDIICFQCVMSRNLYLSGHVQIVRS